MIINDFIPTKTPVNFTSKCITITFAHFSMGVMRNNFRKFHLPYFQPNKHFLYISETAKLYPKWGFFFILDTERIFFIYQKSLLLPTSKFCHHVKFLKNLMKNLEKESRSVNWMPQYDPFMPFWPKQEFSPMKLILILKN